MSQYSHPDLSDRVQWIEQNLDKLFEEYYSIKSGDLVDSAYENDEKFQKFCDSSFDSYCASASDHAYEVYKDQQHN